jgi:peptide-methionine (R)-S-oxide reductase
MRFRSVKRTLKRIRILYCSPGSVHVLFPPALHPSHPVWGKRYNSSNILISMTSQDRISGDGVSRKKIVKTDEEWKQELTPDQYRILREKGTELAFTGKLYQHKETGTYLCAGCGNELFSSDSKYESGSGWPSFYRPVMDQSVETASDRSLWLKRTEVKCERCGGHLGHVFKDGPEPTGMRYCVNSTALTFRKKD